MCGAILLAEAVTPSVDMFAAIERIGLAAALVAFFVWTGWQRESRMAVRMDLLEKENKELVHKHDALTDKIAGAIADDAITLGKALEVLSNRTCMAFPSQDAFETWKRNRKHDNQTG